jgi:ubiquinone biosynthesis monooxygenase Coq7
LPVDEQCSREIVAQMRDDEARHGQAGRDLGRARASAPVKLAMRAASKVMTRTAYWV